MKITKKFKSFITEEETKPYRVLVLKRDVPEDTNNTGDSLEKQAKKMGIDLYQMEVESSYFTTNEKGNLVAHNYENFRERTKGLSFGKEIINHDKKGWEVKLFIKPMSFLPKPIESLIRKNQFLFQINLMG